MAAAQEKPIRLTISVTPEVHAGFERLATASGLSMSKCMGEWLADTLDAVEYTATMVEKARLAPKMVMREVHAYALGLADETGAVLSAMKKGQSIGEVAAQVLPTRKGRRAAGDLPEAGAGRSAAIPPSCNTGGKVPLSPVRDAGRHAAAPKGKSRSTGGKS
jgi:hypothetical protein